MCLSDGSGIDPEYGRQAVLSGLEVWTGQFIALGVQLTKDRNDVIGLLREPFTRIYASLAGEEEQADLVYEPSFDEVLLFDEPAAEISRHFQRIYPGEVARGQNLIGPQRDDLTLRLNDMPAREFASNGLTPVFGVDAGAVRQLFEQCGTLFGNVRELLQRLRITGQQQRSRLVEEVPSGGRIARHQPLVFGGKGHGGDQTHDIPHILRFSAVHARPVGTSRGDGDLICALFARIFDVGPDSGGRVAFFDQRQR